MIHNYDKQVDNKSKAAGILPLCASTGRFLLALRTEGVYSTIGGYLHWGESCRDGAIREFLEETMYDGPLLILKGYTHQSPVKNFLYTNFLGICPEEFSPILDSENVESDWFSLSQLYAGGLPLHRDFENFLIEARPLIDSMMQSFGILNH
jgi:8-oxo-dGTP pyrophosphatase MutT (NUDIX family)